MVTSVPAMCCVTVPCWLRGNCTRARINRTLAAMQFPHRVDGVGVFGLLILPISYHAREAQCQTTRIMRAVLQAVECDLDDELGTHVDRDPFAVGLDRLQLLRLPLEQLVRQSLERLAEHHEAAVLGIAGAEVQVGEFAVPAAVAPLGGHDDQIVCVGLLYFYPVSSSSSCLVRAAKRLGHQPFLTCR